MSKERQIYYNAVFGAIGGLLGWLVVGLFTTGQWNIWTAYAFVGAGIGLFVGGTVGAVEGMVIKQSTSQAIQGALIGAAAGLVSGIFGLLLGQAGFLLLGGGILGRSLGWLLLGLFLGLGDGIVNRSGRRAIYGVAGGTVAGAVGGILYESMTQLFLQRGDTVQMIVGAIGLILIGACLGGIIPFTISMGARGLLRVLNGKKGGLERSIVDAVLLGSYDGCDVYLPGDPGIALKHARIYRKQGTFFLEDLGSQQTFVNNVPVNEGAAVQIDQGTRVRLGSTEMELV